METPANQKGTFWDFRNIPLICEKLQMGRQLQWQCRALPVGWRRSGRSGVAPWWRWSTGRPVDGQTSAGTRCCIPGGPGRGTGRLSADPFSAKRQKGLRNSLLHHVYFDCELTDGKPPARWRSRGFSAELRTCSAPPSRRASSCGRARGGSSSVRTWWSDRASPTRSCAQKQKRWEQTRVAGVQAPPAHQLPGLPTGAVNHVDKDSRPDLLKGINVKMEPGGERGEVRRKIKSSCRSTTRGEAERKLTFQSLCKWAREGWAEWESSIPPKCRCCGRTASPWSPCRCIQSAGSCGTSAEGNDSVRVKGRDTGSFTKHRLLFNSLVFSGETNLWFNFFT